MFHEVRGWWREGRGKHVARLFLFDFMVVMVGVLVAQGLQQWSQDRQAAETMERSRARAYLELSHNLYDVGDWRAAAPCLQQRMKAIMIMAAVGPIKPGWGERPSNKRLIFTPMSDQSALLFRRRYGEETALLVDGLGTNVDNFNRYVVQLSAAWGHLQLADPTNGPVSPGDRLAAREAAADVLVNLRGIGIVGDTVIGRSKKLNIKAVGDTPGIGPARSCDAIWRSGQIDPPMTTR